MKGENRGREFSIDQVSPGQRTTQQQQQFQKRKKRNVKKKYQFDSLLTFRLYTGKLRN